MKRHAALPLSIAAAALLLAILAGCAPASSGTGSDASSAPTPAPAGKSAPVGSSDGACKYLSVAELNSILGRSYVTSTNVPLSYPVNYSYCAFKTAGRAELDLQVSSTDAADVMSVENEAAGNHLAPLAGVGDSALSNSSELVVQFGQVVIAAGDDVTDSGMRAITIAQLKAIVAKAHSAM